MKSVFRDVYFWIVILVLVLADYFFVGTYLDWFDFGVFVGQYRLNHWLGWIGFLFILLYIPLFFTFKRKYVEKIRLFLGIHVLGNLLAYLLITIHFAAQISRPAQFYPDLGTGIALQVFMITLVLTGFLLRFNIISRFRRTWRFLHTSSVTALLVIILIHILHGIQLL